MTYVCEDCAVLDDINSYVYNTKSNSLPDKSTTEDEIIAQCNKVFNKSKNAFLIGYYFDDDLVLLEEAANNIDSATINRNVYYKSKWPKFMSSSQPNGQFNIVKISFVIITSPGQYQVQLTGIIDRLAIIDKSFYLESFGKKKNEYIKSKAKTYRTTYKYKFKSKQIKNNYFVIDVLYMNDNAAETKRNLGAVTIAINRLITKGKKKKLAAKRHKRLINLTDQKTLQPNAASSTHIRCDDDVSSPSQLKHSKSKYNKSFNNISRKNEMITDSSDDEVNTQLSMSSNDSDSDSYINDSTESVEPDDYETDDTHTNQLNKKRAFTKKIYKPQYNHRRINSPSTYEYKNQPSTSRTSKNLADQSSIRNKSFMNNLFGMELTNSSKSENSSKIEGDKYRVDSLYTLLSTKKNKKPALKKAVSSVNSLIGRGKKKLVSSGIFDYKAAICVGAIGDSEAIKLITKESVEKAK